jgi:ATP-dependent RNA helicase DeaD
MLDLGFREDLEFILDASPVEDRRTLMFSATVPKSIATLAQNYQRDAPASTRRSPPRAACRHRISRASSWRLRIATTPSSTCCASMKRRTRSSSATRARREPSDRPAAQSRLHRRRRYPASFPERADPRPAIHARWPRPVCIATDVAARGIDLPNLELVIHADLPTNPDTLLHRSGRTGRAGKKGTSVLLVTHTKRRRTEQVLASANIEATWSGPPTAKEIREQDRQRLLQHPALEAVVSEEDLAVARQLAERFPAEKLAGALIGLLRSELPEPEDVSDDGRMRNAQTFEKQSGHTGSSERTFREPSERPAARSRSERGFAPRKAMASGSG